MNTATNSQDPTADRLAEKDERRIRFRKAYFRMTKKQRLIAQAKFLKIHGIETQTFRAKLSGNAGVSETEIKWMERYNPYNQPQPAEV